MLRMDKTYQTILDSVCNAEEAGAILRVSAERVKQFCREGRLAAKRLGRDWLIVRAAAEALASIDRPLGLHTSKKPPKKIRKKRR
jgi:hypothetical protein